PVTEVCLGCICQAISGCNSTAICNGDVCGLFRMTWAYWSDAGKPTKDNEDPSSQNAYANCANDPYCAARAVQEKGKGNTDHGKNGKRKNKLHSPLNQAVGSLWEIYQHIWGANDI
uniref:lysozyme n=1 Tax=Megaselia scalaris TaxID=36166 RepID=T1GX33_MEGSC